MSDLMPLSDSQGRLLAETTWDHIVVAATGAGKFAVVAIAIGKNEKLSFHDTFD